jgi:UDP-N-acetyl-D-galactosamine dehydrogenase
VPDLRNSKVADVIRRLEWLGHTVTVHDPLADADEAHHEYGLTLDPDALNKRYDAVVAAVPHQHYRQMGLEQVAEFVTEGGLIADVKGIWRGEEPKDGIRKWTL